MYIEGGWAWGLWRNGSASDSKSEGCGFDSLRAHALLVLLRGRKGERSRVYAKSGFDVL